jgi:hypothetical protein
MTLIYTMMCQQAGPKQLGRDVALADARLASSLATRPDRATAPNAYAARSPSVTSARPFEISRRAEAG